MEIEKKTINIIDKIMEAYVSIIVYISVIHFIKYNIKIMYKR
jgi:hypothetical protein